MKVSQQGVPREIREAGTQLSKMCELLRLILTVLHFEGVRQGGSAVEDGDLSRDCESEEKYRKKKKNKMTPTRITSRRSHATSAVSCSSSVVTTRWSLSLALYSKRRPSVSCTSDSLPFAGANTGRSWEGE